MLFIIVKIYKREEESFMKKEELVIKAMGICLTKMGDIGKGVEGERRLVEFVKYLENFTPGLTKNYGQRKKKVSAPLCPRRNEDGSL